MNHCVSLGQSGSEGHNKREIDTLSVGAVTFKPAAQKSVHCYTALLNIDQRLQKLVCAVEKNQGRAFHFVEAFSAYTYTF